MNQEIILTAVGFIGAVGVNGAILAYHSGKKDSERASIQKELTEHKNDSEKWHDKVDKHIEGLYEVEKPSKICSIHFENMREDVMAMNKKLSDQISRNIRSEKEFAVMAIGLEQLNINVTKHMNAVVSAFREFQKDYDFGDEAATTR